MKKSPDAFRTISEVAAWLGTPAHVLRFWESRFPDLKPVQRAGGRRYYRPQDMLLLGGIKHLLHTEGHTIKAVQDRIKAEGTDAVAAFSPPLDPVADPGAEADDTMAAPTAPPVDAVEDLLAMAAQDGAPVPAEPDAGRPQLMSDGDAPPIGFFFDDSDDAAPAEDQSGTFALARAPEPPPAPAPEDDLRETEPPAPMPDAAPAGPRIGELPPLPDDPDDDAAGYGAPLPLAARLRAVHPDDIPGTHRSTLTGLFRRLDGWQRARV